MCAGEFLHSVGLGLASLIPLVRGWGPRAVMLIQVSQKSEPSPVPSSLKHRNPFYSLPASPLSTSQLRFTH